MFGNLKKKLFTREAALFDAPLFVLKTFVAVFVGYGLFHWNPLIGKDMISVLLGLMLTLQPVNISGLKSGWEQLSASLIGGAVTGVIVLIGGVNMITVPLAVALTLYITLRINWRSMSVIAVFTSIYMTQYIQLNAAGEASMLLTFRLRLLALGSGILVAIIVNFIFSMVFYKAMMRKRTIYIVENILNSLDEFIKLIGVDETGDFLKLEKKIILLFSDIDFILGGLLDIRRRKSPVGKTAVFVEKVRALRDINHYLLDMVMLESAGNEYSEELDGLMALREQFAVMGSHIGKGTMQHWKPVACSGKEKNLIRISNSMKKIASLER